MINLQKLNMSSHFAGLKNYLDTSFGIGVASQSLGAGSYIRVTGTTPVNVANGIPLVKIRYNGLQANWRPLPGYVITNFPVYDWPDYQIQTFCYIKNGLLYIDTYISNQAGVTVSIPNITIEVLVSFYIAPFN